MRFTLPLSLLLAFPVLAPADDFKLKPKDGHFSVRFPGKPKETTQTAKSPIGDLKVYTATFATADGNAYLVSYTEFPAEAIKPENRETLYDGARTGLLGNDGKVAAEKKVEVGRGKLAGREILIDKGKQQLRYRVVAKDTRLYQVAI